MKSCLCQALLIVFLLICFSGPDAIAQNVRDAVEVKNAVADVLADPEYRHLQKDEPEPDDEDFDLPEWFEDFLRWLFTPRDVAPSVDADFDLGAIFFYGSLGVLVVILIVFMYWTLNIGDETNVKSPFGDDADEEAINPTKPAGEIPANEYARRAQAAAEAGDYRTAIRELVLGSMSWTERVGLIRHRRGLTNRDYVRAIWRQVERRESLLQIVAAFERVFYGHRLADRLTFEACFTEFQKSFLSEASDAQPTT
jgi:hypothetical protein